MAPVPTFFHGCSLRWTENKSMRRSIALNLIVLSALLATPAFARDLYWKDLAVTATLDANGTLHVTEVHKMVFTGDWNGGERSFRLGRSVTFGLDSLQRIADDQTGHFLTAGDLAKVDHYGWSGDHVLRWRSRLPSDPDFDHTVLTYAIRAHYGNILKPGSGKKYILDHLFAFPDRTGVIEHFSLHLDLDPVWSGVQSPVVIEQTNIPPGSSAPVRLDLTYTGSGVPADVKEPVAAPLRYLLLAFLLGGILYLAVDFRWHELETGRLEPLVPLSEIDQEWLQKNVFNRPPEVVGAAWDEETGAPEVAAVLARMSQEGKIRSTVEKGGFFSKPKLLLELLTPRQKLSGYELSLVKAFFFDGDKTDSEKIRKHYASSGFDPANKIKSSLDQILGGIPSWNKKSSKFPKARVLWSFIIAVPLLIAGGVGGSLDAGVAVGTVFIGIIALIVSILIAIFNKNAVTGVGLRAAAFFVFLLPLIYYVGSWLKPTASPLRFLTMAGIVVWTLSVLQLVFESGKCRATREKIDFRKKLASARAWFINQLRQKSPQLEDSWYPYLLAFGLGSNVDRWFSSFGSAATAASTFTAASSSSSTTSSGSSSASGWTGGGGTFGGAGASGSWAIAAGSLASGVAAPSSSSGGGGGGGGGSSGGGGGGGW
jgi:uncharacterized membrane protein YgcG